MTNAEPFVSVITPFYNTADYLEECIQSVLAQSYGNFEYVLVDNQSTDESGAIARRFAESDPRIRLVTTPSFLTQVQNYNFAIDQMSPRARYLKIVQADDWLFPRCLTEMVALADEHPTAAVVGSYELREDQVHAVGLHIRTRVLSGREACRLYLIQGKYLFGSPTTVLYRADVVRGRKPFYEEGRLHEDTEIVFELLREHDFGFVHQVLSFVRQQEASITGSSHDFLPHQLIRLIIIKRYGAEYLNPSEFEACLDDAHTWYYRSLARRCLLHLAVPETIEFWDYQRQAFASMGETIHRWLLARHLGGVLLENLFSPITLISNLKRSSERFGTGSRSSRSSPGSR